MHVYPGYDRTRWITSLMRNMKPDSGCVTGVLFAERKDCHFVAGLREGRESLPGWTVRQIGSGSARTLRLEASDGRSLFCWQGRQLVTEEGIEVLAWLTDVDLVSGQSLGETLEQVRQAGGIPALAWAPGKWWGRRGECIRHLLESVDPRSLMLCDSRLRPFGWPEPALMRWAMARGFNVLAGSDPLPLAGQELESGVYRTSFDGVFDTDQPGESLRTLFMSPQAFSRGGRRSAWFQVISWVIRMRWAKGT
ncbi:MAG: hypothetical protein A2498_11755 [Lentisphaerae bacterium RIFOXYC12_FULL_60_16]|nr:MAG: hypothetical protein A2498_11755 [Lentisphaerae bacterium RIFOXYC12_FULL_60_16]OGV75144.1 MAG: hypothetical protein A2269_05760 [Lentisphaerae bacterium RIFOXYA12_FULL_60_10]OGV77275.1 MAG: hypothetical protein A2340_06100 [Lentisphaerae bacterium RIFOXYB12_FULL_60_10]